jgi:hypothetical protein
LEIIHFDIDKSITQRELQRFCNVINHFQLFSPVHVFLSFCAQILNRFPEVAKLCYVWWLEIRGMINTLALSPNTQYGAYLVFKMIDPRGFENLPVDLTVGVEGDNSSTKVVCLEPYVEPQPSVRNRARRLRRYRHLGDLPNRVAGLQRPSGRSDGWLEIEMGEFFNSDVEHEEVHMSVMETKAGEVKGNFFVEGIEIRPKEDN